MQKNRIIGTPAFYLVKISLANRTLRRAAFWLTRTIVYSFFFIQFQTHWHWKKRKVVLVDHPLDEVIPFRPEDVGLYMSFTSLWQKTAGFFRKICGPSANTVVEDFLRGLGSLYEKAGRIYDRCQSTTTRPGPRLHPAFLKIHLFDPHLHCVPSLHVMVVCYTAEWLERMAAAHGENLGDYGEEVAYVKRQAAEIIDTILTVKQHSVNCVAAGLYFLNALHPQYSREACGSMVDNLLFTLPDLPRREEVRDYCRRLLDWFFAAHDRAEEPDAAEILLQFLEEYSFGHFTPGEPSCG